MSMLRTMGVRGADARVPQDWAAGVDDVRRLRVTIDGSWTPWVSGESRGQVTWDRPGAWPYACLALTTGWALPSRVMGPSSLRALESG